MKIGDKVRFLNAMGGGTVKSFLNKDLVLIEDEEGFDTPTLRSECVVIGSTNEVQVRQSVQPFNNGNSSMQVSDPDSHEQDVAFEETKEGENITACLVFLPLDVKSISTTNYECYLINESNYFLNYTYLNKMDDGWHCRSTGVIEPNTKVFIEEFGKQELNDLERVCVQFLAYKKNKPFDLKNVYSSELRIDTVKFYKLHSFKQNDYFDDDALIFPLVKKDLPQKELTILPTELEIALMEKKQSSRSPIAQVKKQIKNQIIEVDLHITELLDSTAGLSAADILDYQISKFREILDENNKNKGQKIVFIHGKGNGVLKKAIQDELKNRYKSHYSQDASFREYGFGATMITIR